MIFNDGDRLDTEWRNSRANGIGIYTTRDGNQYEG